MGQSIFKVYKYLDGSLKALSPALGKRDPASIASQCWVPSDPADNRERLLVGTNDGEVLLLEVRRGTHESPMDTETAYSL